MRAAAARELLEAAPELRIVAGVVARQRLLVAPLAVLVDAVKPAAVEGVDKDARRRRAVRRRHCKGCHARGNERGRALVHEVAAVVVEEATPAGVELRDAVAV